jgi:hypothetical protein
MAIATRCSTPGATYSTTISGDTVMMVVHLPRELDLTEKEAGHLEDTLHNALEMALAPVFIEGSGLWR